MMTTAAFEIDGEIDTDTYIESTQTHRLLMTFSNSPKRTFIQAVLERISAETALARLLPLTPCLTLCRRETQRRGRTHNVVYPLQAVRHTYTINWLTTVYITNVISTIHTLHTCQHWMSQFPSFASFASFATLRWRFGRWLITSGWFLSC